LRRQSHTMIMALLAAALAGCATYPENASYLYGERYYRANIRTFPTNITAVDGQSTIRRYGYGQVPIEPGPHVIRLVTAPVAGLTIPQERELNLNVEPCKRYWIVAERDNRLEQDWRPVIEYVENAGGRYCR
jgi:hypothetical protein